MSRQLVAKLVRLGLSPEDAEKLGKARLLYPSQIREAKDKDLLAIPGIGPAAVARIREKMPKVR